MPIILNRNYLWHKNKSVELLDLTLAQDWDTYLWTGSCRLAYLADYMRVRIGDLVVLYLQGFSYSLIVQSRSHSVEGQTGAIHLIVRVSSLTVRLAEEKITKTWNAMTALSICKDVAKGFDIEWQIINWLIPAGRFTVFDQTPIEIIRRIAKAAGAIVQTTREGKLRVQYQTAFKKRCAAPPSRVYTHIFLFKEESPHGQYYNACIISDGEERENEERHYFAQYIELNRYSGTLSVYSQPWHDQFTIVHAGHKSIRIGTAQIKYRTETEQVEFKAGLATVSYPIYRLQRVKWQSKNLGSPVWQSDRQELKLTVSGINGYGLAQVDYLVRRFEFPIKHRLTHPQTTQFLVILL
ncbi:MAG: hypothetical protein B6247_07780 [Candidatus Parabeggiatoa sp. nov. 2]|nr:MAG: hypothetical protein B6247_07780 [Beggiatoa sp. 4572_84]